MPTVTSSTARQSPLKALLKTLVSDSMRKMKSFCDRTFSLSSVTSVSSSIFDPFEVTEFFLELKLIYIGIRQQQDQSKRKLSMPDENHA